MVIIAQESGSRMNASSARQNRDPKRWSVNKCNCKEMIRNEPNSVGFAREKAQIMSFVERGFERLGLDHQMVGFSWCSYKVKFSLPLESFS